MGSSKPEKSKLKVKVAAKGGKAKELLRALAPMGVNEAARNAANQAESRVH